MRFFITRKCKFAIVQMILKVSRGSGGGSGGPGAEEASPSMIFDDLKRF